MDMEITFPGGQRVEAVFKGHTITTDQPLDSGGDGIAPSPFDLFLASLGTCAGYYVLSFCEEREIPFAGIRLTQEMTWDPQAKLMTPITIKIHLPPDFPEKYRGAVLKAAEFCTVKRHLKTPPTVETVLA